MLKQKKHKA